MVTSHFSLKKTKENDFIHELKLMKKISDHFPALQVDRAVWTIKTQGRGKTYVVGFPTTVEERKPTTIVRKPTAVSILNIRSGKKTYRGGQKSYRDSGVH